MIPLMTNALMTKKAPQEHLFRAIFRGRNLSGGFVKLSKEKKPWSLAENAITRLGRHYILDSIIYLSLHPQQKNMERGSGAILVILQLP